MGRAKIKEREQARNLRSQGRSLNEIVRHVKVAKSSVSTWVRDIALNSEQKERLWSRELTGATIGRDAAQRYWQEYRKIHPRVIPQGPRWPKRNVEEFFDTWTPEMAYVLGFFAADGCMYQNKRGSCYVGFYSTDKPQIDLIKKLVNVSNEIERYQSSQPNRKKSYTLQIGSRKIYSRLQELGFTPAKSLSLRFPEVPDEMMSPFVRGYLDGDGCVYFAMHYRKGRDKAYPYFDTRFICGSRKFLVSLQRKLPRLAGVSKGSLRIHSRAWELGYGAKDSRQLYKFMYPTPTVPHLERKKRKFEEALAALGP